MGLPPRSALWQMALLGSLGFFGVLLVAWWRLPDVQGGARIVAVEIAKRLGVADGAGSK